MVAAYAVELVMVNAGIARGILLLLLLLLLLWLPVEHLLKEVAELRLHRQQEREERDEDVELVAHFADRDRELYVDSRESQREA